MSPSGSAAPNASETVSASESGAAVSRLLGEASLLLREETAQGARLLLDQAGRWASLPAGEEKLFQPQREAIELNETDMPALAEMGDALADRWLIYAYPLCLDPRGVGLGLIQVMVRLSRGRQPGQWFLRRASNRAPQVNQRLLQAVGGDTAVAGMIAARLAGPEGGSWLPEALGHLALAVGQPREAFEPTRLDPSGLAAGKPPQQRQWINAAAIFDATPGPDSAGRFRLDDQASLEAATHERAFTGTGLGVLAGAHANTLPSDPNAPQDGPTPVIEVHPLGSAQSDIVTSVRDRPLTAAEIPPGCARLQTVIATIATSIMAGERVLYVASQVRSADTLARAVQDMLHRDHLWLLPIPRSHNLGDTRGRIVQGLRAFQESEFEPRRKKRKGRDRPTLRYLNELHQARRGVDEQISRIQKLIDNLLAAKTARRDREADVPKSWGPLFDPKGKAPMQREQFEAIQRGFSLRTGRTSLGLGQRLRELVKREGPPSFNELDKMLRQGLGGLSAGARETVLAELNPTPDEKGVKKFLKLYETYFAWRDACDAEAQAGGAIDQTGGAQRAERERFRTTNMVVSTARELLEDYWFDRTSAAPRNIEQQLKALFTLFQRRTQAKESRQRSDENDDIVVALKELLEIFPMLSMTADSALDLLPANPDLVDLVIVDEGEAVAAGALPALAMRGRRTLVVAENDIMGPKGRRRDHSAYDMAAAALSADDHTTGGGGEADPGYQRVDEHFRCHPDIVAYLGQCLGVSNLKLRSDYAKLVEGLGATHPGLIWHDMRPMPDQPMRRGYDGTACMDMLRQWESDGLFDQLPRRRFGVLCPTQRSADGIAQMLDNNFRDPNRRRAITCGTAERFLGGTVDLMIFLPGVAEDSGRSEANLMAHDPTLCIQAMAAARCGLHIIGDAALCREIGGYLTLLADMATQRGTGHHYPADKQDASAGDDPLRRAFGNKAARHDDKDPEQMLTALLDRARLYYQPMPRDSRLAADLPEAAQEMLKEDPHFRVIAAFGIVFCVIGRPSLLGTGDSQRRQREKAAEAALTHAGYRVFWFDSREMEEKPDLVVERLRQLI